MPDTTTDHDPSCGTSRNALALLRHAELGLDDPSLTDDDLLDAMDDGDVVEDSGHRRA